MGLGTELPKDGVFLSESPSGDVHSLSLSVCVSLPVCQSVSLSLCPPCFSVPRLPPPCPKDTDVGTAGSRGDSRSGYHYMEDVQTCQLRPAATAWTQTRCKSLTHLPARARPACLAPPLLTAQLLLILHPPHVHPQVPPQCLAHRRPLDTYCRGRKTAGSCQLEAGTNQHPPA